MTDQYILFRTTRDKLFVLEGLLESEIYRIQRDPDASIITSNGIEKTGPQRIDELYSILGAVREALVSPWEKS